MIYGFRVSKELVFFLFIFSPFLVYYMEVESIICKICNIENIVD